MRGAPTGAGEIRTGVGTVTGRADDSGWCKVTWESKFVADYRAKSLERLQLS